MPFDIKPREGKLYMVWWLAFAVFLYLACAILLMAEVFIPSGGLLTICAIGCVVGGAYLFLVALLKS